MMKKLLLAFAMLAFVVTAQAASERLKPFVLAEVTSGDVTTVQEQVAKKLTDAGFEIVGSYSPYKDAAVIAITNDALKQNAAQSDFGGYGAAQRVAITKVGDDVQVSYTHPTYMSHAYRMSGDLAGVTELLEKTLGNQQTFGSEKGLRVKKLRKYHYMFGMEYFDDLNMHELAQYPNHEQALKTVEQNLAKGVAGVKQVYRIDIPGKDEVVFGVSRKMPAQGGDKYMDESFIMGIIDFKDLKATAHLPYEIMVSGNKVYHLYARFRIAINFPDLSMMGSNSFMNIVESPEAIKKALAKTAGGQVTESYW
ncbi:MAG: hypothetical protein OQL05_10965 [Gammaproteobacteria bacterium]|nr:hypothetical protein [Gammaproteobacteria bacterium]MCW8958395.1 hypothetical protein [Gammaproteobacteria bacterium]MCW8973780.1 hypothetical protein [Gammaproteobacteria bacterium]MCW8991599.1 hypothetical protein [Gammaproteobacteria bacterium]